MRIGSRSLLMEIMKSAGGDWVYAYMRYIWQLHPQLVYYGVMVGWGIVCVVYNVGVAQAAGNEIIVGETVAAHMSRNFLVNNNYIGVKRVPFPNLGLVEGYQHVQLSTAFYHTGWHLDGGKCIPLRRNGTQGFNLPDVMITNGIQVLTFEFKCTTGNNFHIDAYISYMKKYKNIADVLAVSCVQKSAYTQASTEFMNKCVRQHMEQPEVLLTLLTANEQGADLPAQTQHKLTEYVEFHKGQITQKEYDIYNNAMDAHTAAGGTPATLYTAHPDTEVKQQLIATLLDNMKLVGLTKEGCLLSQHKLIYPD